MPRHTPDPSNADRSDDFFYFDLAEESHEKLLENELKEAKENPLEPISEVTKVEY